MIPLTPVASFKPPMVNKAAPDATSSTGASSSTTALAVMPHALEAIGAVAAASANGIQANGIKEHSTHHINIVEMDKKERASQASQQSSQCDVELADFAFENDFEHMQLTIDAITTTCAMALKLPPPQSNADINEMHNMVSAILKQRRENQKTIEKAEQAIRAQQEEIQKKMAEIKRQKQLTDLAIKDLAKQQADYNLIMQTKSKMQAVFKEIEKNLKCPSCEMVTLLPKALGCGHVACENCVALRSDEIRPIPMTAATAAASAHEHIQEGRCPCCKEVTVGSGFPVLALKYSAELLSKAELIKVSRVNVEKSTHKGQIAYKPRTTEITNIEALQLASWSQSQLALLSLECVFQHVTREQLTTGFFVHFDLSCSKMFFQTFSERLGEKFVEANLRANNAKRLLRYQMIEKFNDIKSAGAKISELEQSIEILSARMNELVTAANHDWITTVKKHLTDATLAIDAFRKLAASNEPAKPDDIDAAVQKAIAATIAADEAANPKLKTRLLIQVFGNGQLTFSTTEEVSPAELKSMFIHNVYS